jgi:hypothetical protein
MYARGDDDPAKIQGPTCKRFYGDRSFRPTLISNINRLRWSEEVKAVGRNRARWKRYIPIVYLGRADGEGGATKGHVQKPGRSTWCWGGQPGKGAEGKCWGAVGWAQTEGRPSFWLAGADRVCRNRGGEGTSLIACVGWGGKRDFPESDLRAGVSRAPRCSCASCIWCGALPETTCPWKTAQAGGGAESAVDLSRGRPWARGREQAAGRETGRRSGKGPIPV